MSAIIEALQFASDPRSDEEIAKATTRAIGQAYLSAQEAVRSGSSPVSDVSAIAAGLQYLGLVTESRAQFTRLASHSLLSVHGPVKYGSEE